MTDPSVPAQPEEPAIVIPSTEGERYFPDSPEWNDKEAREAVQQIEAVRAHREEMERAGVPAQKRVVQQSTGEQVVVRTTTSVGAQDLDSRQLFASPKEREDTEAEQFARRFHEVYERLAPQFGYETRRASAVPWPDVPENNRRLMIAVCDEVTAPLRSERATRSANNRALLKENDALLAENAELLALLQESGLRFWHQLERPVGSDHEEHTPNCFACRVDAVLSRAKPDA